MVSFYDSLSPDLIEWCLRQSIFWTASAPLVGKHVNVSPKGLPSSSFSILGPNQAAYLDATGSGSETISHIYENGRVTVLFNSFEKSPRILRLFCTGKVVEWDHAEFPVWIEKMGKDKELKGARAVILLDIFKVQTSCGFGVPILTISPGETEEKGVPKAVFEDRSTINKWAEHKIVEDKLIAYRAEWNRDSLDGLPGIRAARRANGERFLWIGDSKAWVGRVLQTWDVLAVGMFVGASIAIVGASFRGKLEKFW
ncbi:hypothetical protein RUND412_000386 [Rhizina undulata]